MLKITSSVFYFCKSSEIIGSLQKSSDVFINLWKISEIVAKCLKLPSYFELL